MKSESHPIDASAPFLRRTLDSLVIEDEGSFRHVELYGDLKAVLQQGAYQFRVLPETPALRYDQALLLNLTFWGAQEGGDLLVDQRIAADVVTHAAWHHLAARAFPGEPGRAPSALFLGESIASAFDVYLVGRLLGHAPDSLFLETQVPAMAEAAFAAGLPEEQFDALLQEVAADPDRAFEDLRQLLFDATAALYRAGDAESGYRALRGLENHRFACLLHRYELSNWVLYARAYGRDHTDAETRVQLVDRALRDADVSLDWLSRHWLDLP